jgi:hypothetical protein
MHHGRHVVIALAALAALMAQTSANAAERAHARSTGCAATMTFLVWPHGHPAIAAIGFADMSTPHMEIYKGSDTGYPRAQFLAWAAGGKTAEPSPSTTPACLSFATVPKTLKPVAAMSTIARTAAVTCKFPGSGSIDIKKLSGGANRYRIRVLLSGGRLGAQTDITPAGVKFHYPAKLCHLGTAPAA